MEVKGAQIERTEDGAVNDLSVDLFFMKQPELLPLYLEIERAVRDRLGDFEVVVQKSQITWKGPGSFAALWLPRWKRPDGRIYVGLSFFLEFQVSKKEQSPILFLSLLICLFRILYQKTSENS